MSSDAAAGGPGYNLSDGQDREDRRKHLELVSTVISRMSSASTVSKGWCVSIAGAAFGVALVRDNWIVLVVGVILAASFGVLDAFYLATEKRYRDLYRAIVEDNSVSPFSMRTPAVVPAPATRSYLSWSILFFYIPLVLALSLCVTISIVSSAATESDQGRCHHAEAHAHPRNDRPHDDRLYDCQNPRKGTR